MQHIMLTLLLAILSLGDASAQSVGFVDVQRVINEYKLTADLTSTLEKKLQQNTTELKREEAKLLTQARSLQDPARSSEDPVALLREEKEVELGRIRLETKKRVVQFELEKDLVEHMKKVYKEVLREIEAIARDRSLAAVYYVNKHELIGRTREDLAREFFAHTVLYYDKNLELTDEIIQRLNR